MTYKHGATRYDDVAPTVGTNQWKRRVPNVDCINCWPSRGWGYRPTRKGKENAKRLTMHDVKGICFTCAGTGLEAIPFTEVIRGGDWGRIDVVEWLNDDPDLRK